MIPQKSSIFNPKSENKLQIVRLSPQGKSAVGMVLLRGPNAAETFAKFWNGPNLLFESKPIFGRFQFAESEQAEEIVVHALSPTEIEIYGHGGSAVLNAIESAFLTEGAETCSWQEIFAPGNSQRELALKLLPFASTERTAQILLDQCNGALERELDEIESLNDADEKQKRLKRLEENARFAKHLIEPFKVVFAGGVNAGKSSLLNKILGFQRVIADATPGTTRDTVSVQTALDGFPVQFHDTAGFRSVIQTGGHFDLERQGIERSESLLAEADLVVWLVDSTVSSEQQPSIPEIENLLICFNKIDLSESCITNPQDREFFSRRSATNGSGSAHRAEARLTAQPCWVPKETVAVSAVQGQGIEELLQQIISRLIFDPPKPFEAVPLNLHHNPVR